jgi:hypothetical protein
MKQLINSGLMKQLYHPGLVMGLALTTLVGCSAIKREPITLSTAVNQYMESIQAKQSSAADTIAGMNPYSSLGYQPEAAKNNGGFGGVKLKFSGNVTGLDYRSNIGGDRVKLEATVKAEVPGFGEIIFRVVNRGRGKNIENIDEVRNYLTWAEKSKTPVTFIGYTSDDFDPVGSYNKHTINLIKVELESIKDDHGNLHENVAIDTNDSWEDRYEQSTAKKFIRAIRGALRLIP